MVVVFIFLMPLIAILVCIISLVVLLRGKARNTAREYQNISQKTSPEPMGTFYARLELLKHDLGKYIDEKFPNHSSWQLMDDLNKAIYKGQIIVTMCVNNKHADVFIKRLKDGTFMLEEEYKAMCRQEEEMEYQESQKQNMQQ